MATICWLLLQVTKTWESKDLSNPFIIQVKMPAARTQQSWPPRTHTHPDETSLPRAWVGEESDRVLRDVCCVVLGDVKSYISCAKEQNCIG